MADHDYMIGMSATGRRAQGTRAGTAWERPLKERLIRACGGVLLIGFGVLSFAAILIEMPNPNTATAVGLLGVFSLVYGFTHFDRYYSR